MTVIALEALHLTDQARAELGARPPAPLFQWCASLWGDNPVHQCVRDPRHAGACRCVCGDDRSPA